MYFLQSNEVALKPTFTEHIAESHDDSTGKFFSILMSLLCVACIVGGVAIMYKRQMMPRKFNVSLKFKNTSVNNGDGAKLKMSMPKPAASTPRLNEIVLNSNDTSSEVFKISKKSYILIIMTYQIYL